MKEQLTIILCACLLLGTTNVQGQTTSKKLTWEEAYRAIEQSLSYAKHLEYSRAVQQAIEKKEEIPPRNPNTKGIAFLNNLADQLLVAIDEASLPRENPDDGTTIPLPKDLGSNDMKVKIAALNQGARYLNQANTQIFRATTMVSEVKNSETLAEETQKDVRALMQVIRKIVELGPPKKIKDILGYTYLDLENHVVPRLADVRLALRAKATDFEAEVSRRRTSMSNLAGNLTTYTDEAKSTLENERNSVQGKLDRLFGGETMEVVDAKLQAEFDKLKSEERSIQAEHKRYQADHEKYKEDWETYYREFKDHQQTEKEIGNMTYNLCPNNVKYEDCKHEDQKKKYSENLKRKVSQFNARHRALETRLGRLQKEVQRLEKWAGEIDAKVDDFIAKRDPYYEREKTFKAEIRQHGQLTPALELIQARIGILAQLLDIYALYIQP